MPFSALTADGYFSPDEKYPELIGKVANELAAGDQFRVTDLADPILFHGKLLYFTKIAQLPGRNTYLLSTDLRSGSTSIIVDYQKPFLSLSVRRLVFDVATDQVYVLNHSAIPGGNLNDAFVTKIVTAQA